MKVLAMTYAPSWSMLALTMAAFKFVGIIWNTVSVSHRQRKIPDVMLGRVNSLFRMPALGLMPFGLILSGLIVRYAEPLIGRSDALYLPMVGASIGALMLGLRGWPALNRGFQSR